MQNYEVDIAALDFVRRDSINHFLKELLILGGSDLHVKSGGFIYARIGNEIKKLSNEIFTQQDGIILAKELLRTRFAELVEQKSVDFSHRLEDGNRFRVNIFFQLEGVSIVFRLIPNKIPTFEERFMPPIVEKICDTVSKGIILIAGQPGSGKSMTVSSMVERINLTKRQHIITIEDPIEFVHTDAMSIISQRAIGQDTLDFENAIKSALREDPDVIVVGEIRDLKTIKAILLASQIGYLVIGVINGSGIREIINFLIGLFPQEERRNAISLLANNIEAVIAQRAVKTLQNDIRIATAIMINSQDVKNAIMNSDEDGIYLAIERGRDAYGMQTFDQCLFELYSQGIIDENEALQKASDVENLRRKIKNSNLAINDIVGFTGDAELVEQLKFELN